MNKKLQTAKYILADFFCASLAWGCFYIYRKMYIESVKFGYDIPVSLDNKFYFGITVIPAIWIFFYWLTGTYNNVYRKSRLRELGQTLYHSTIGVLIIFFTLLLDDEVVSYKTYYQLFFTLLFLHFIFTATARFILTSVTNRKIHKRLIGFHTLMVGGNQNALNLFHEIQSQFRSQGNKFIGFVSIDDCNGHLLDHHLPRLGNYHELRKLIHEHYVEEVLIAIESSEHDKIGRIINQVEDARVIVKIIPDMYDILSGSVKMTAIYGAPLIEISPYLMPVWQQHIKRLMDIVVSALVMAIFSPVFILTALAVVLTSRGPILYSHERIGRHGKPFTIYKFRSMYTGAEKDTPMLSSRNDSRITPFGKFMRKTRLDEIPQFYNVLTGDMSLVGPRPERQFFIDQIVKIAPHYYHLHKVRPGITSWGQIKFGYAENVDQMVERLKYDVMYIENMSLALDIKILINTVLIVVEGRGK